jgi:hypothetical protein
MAKNNKTTIKPDTKSGNDKAKAFSENGKMIREGYQPKNTVNTNNPPKQNSSDKKD